MSKDPRNRLNTGARNGASALIAHIVKDSPFSVASSFITKISSLVFLLDVSERLVRID